MTQSPANKLIDALTRAAAGLVPTQPELAGELGRLAEAVAQYEQTTEEKWATLALCAAAVAKILPVLAHLTASGLLDRLKTLPAEQIHAACDAVARAAQTVAKE